MKRGSSGTRARRPRSDLTESRGLLDATVADAARLSGELDAARAEACATATIN